MVRLPPSRFWAAARVLPCLLAGLVLTASAGAAEEEPCNESVVVNGDAVNANYKTNNIQLRNVVISRCDIRVAARNARATGLDFDNARWTFDGDVRINVERRGSLRSDQAVVDFRNNEISKATITGSPAEFEQKRGDAGAMAQGRAGEIIYDVAAGTVKLSEDAWLSNGGTEIRSPQIVYDIRKEQVQSSTPPGGNGRVHITITPKAQPRKAVPAPAPNPDRNPEPNRGQNTGQNRGQHAGQTPAASPRAP